MQEHFIEETLNDASMIECLRAFNVLADELASDKSDHGLVVKEVLKHLDDISWRPDSL